MTDAPTEQATIVPTDPAPTPDAEVVLSNDVTPADQLADPAPAPAELEADDTPRKGRAQERIEDLVAERNAAKEYAEYWRERSLELMNQNRPTQNQPVPEPEVPQVPDLPPTLDQYNYDQKAHAQAVADWSAAKVRSEVAKTLEQNASQQAQQELARAFEARVETFKESHADFDIVMANPRLPQLDRLAAVMIVNSEHGAAISYELGKDPALATRISRMTPAQQALAIGRLETKVSQPVNPKPVVTAPATAPTPKPKPVITKAPEPPTPIPSGGAPQATPENMDVKEWMRNRVGEVRNRRRGY